MELSKFCKLKIVFWLVLSQFLLTILERVNANKSLVYVTLSPKGDKANVRLVVDEGGNENDYSVLLPQNGQSVPLPLLYRSSARAPKKQSDNSVSGGAFISPDEVQPRKMSVYGTQLELPPNGTLVYELGGQTNRIRFNGSRLRMCVYGDYRADVMYTRELNLSAYGERSGCELNLFIGKITWEQRNCLSPGCPTSAGKPAAAPNPSRDPADVGLSFSPFSMLHDNANSSMTSLFGSVPSIFGAIGHNLNETAFFDCTEVGDIAFIQTTVELSTVAKLGSDHNTEQFKYVEQYFRETMLNELECKLQELHRRPKRPWIITYLTHPSLINEKQTEVLMLKDNDRFFEILNRYHIDLLLSCGVEGMSEILKGRQQNNPTEELPPYLGTTMATCLNAQDCQYLVLEVGANELDYWYVDGQGRRQRDGKFPKSTQNPEACIPDRIPSITGSNTKNGR